MYSTIPRSRLWVAYNPKVCLFSSVKWQFLRISNDIQHLDKEVSKEVDCTFSELFHVLTTTLRSLLWRCTNCFSFLTRVACVGILWASVSTPLEFVLHHEMMTCQKALGTSKTPRVNATETMWNVDGKKITCLVENYETHVFSMDLWLNCGGGSPNGEKSWSGNETDSRFWGATPSLANSLCLITVHDGYCSI